MGCLILDIRDYFTLQTSKKSDAPCIDSARKAPIYSGKHSKTYDHILEEKAITKTDLQSLFHIQNILKMLFLFCDLRTNAPTINIITCTYGDNLGNKTDQKPFKSIPFSFNYTYGAPTVPEKIKTSNRTSNDSKEKINSQNHKLASNLNSGLVYYNYRYYSPELGRWLKRDDIGERGGANLYGMVGNNVIIKWDYLGLRTPYELHHIVGEWFARYSNACGDRSGGIKILLHWQFHRGAGTGLEVQLTRIRNLMQSGQLNQWQAYNRIMLHHIRHSPQIIRHMIAIRVAARDSGRPMVVASGGAYAYMSFLGYTSTGQLLMGATGVGLVAVGATGTYIASKALINLSLYNYEHETNNAYQNAYSRIGVARGKRDSSQITESIMVQMRCCETTKANDCSKKFVNSVSNNFGFYYGLASQGALKQKLPDIRLAVLESKFKKYIKCLEEQANCKPAACCNPK